jgi:hypothetical protein
MEANRMIVHFISYVDYFGTLELVEYLITKVEVLRMAEGEVRITYDTHVFGFSHIGWFWLVW